MYFEGDCVRRTVADRGGPPTGTIGIVSNAHSTYCGVHWKNWIGPYDNNMGAGYWSSDNCNMELVSKAIDIFAFLAKGYLR